MYISHCLDQLNISYIYELISFSIMDNNNNISYRNRRETKLGTQRELADLREHPGW